MGSDLTALFGFLPQLADGVLVTVQLALGGAAGSLVLALVLGLAMVAPTRWLSVPARIVVEFFRGTSLLVQLFWLFYVLPLLGFELDPLMCGILALSLNYGAYSAEVVRSSIEHVPRGQWEASMALSLSPGRRMFRIILPQAWALMIPSLATLQIQLLKGTAVASFLTLQDLNERIGVLRQSTGDTLFSYSVGFLVYFVLAWLIQVTMDLLERLAKRRLGRDPGDSGFVGRVAALLGRGREPAVATGGPKGGGA
jgi:polar amino acid transport system permease protein